VMPMTIASLAPADAVIPDAGSAGSAVFAESEPTAELAAAQEQEQERAEVLARARARAERIQSALDRTAESRLRAAACTAKTNRMRVVWLQRAADVVGRAVQQAGGIACRQGCAHCCHIPVLLTTAEADEIARATGRVRAKHPAHGARAAELLQSSNSERLLQEARAGAEDRYTGQPCPFLQSDQTCGIYDVRPLACRMHFSLADDERPCRLGGTHGGQTGAEVITLHVMARRVDDAVTLGLGQVVADIRAWFAAGSL
jgi:Fe-S-cluster containining protein